MELTDKRRLRYIKVSPAIYIRLLTNQQIGDIIKTPLPADTRYVRGGTDSIGTLLLVIESKEFEEIEDGEEIPFYGQIEFKRGNIPSSNKDVH